MQFLEFTPSNVSFILEDTDGFAEINMIQKFREYYLTLNKTYVRITIEAVGIYWNIFTKQLILQTGHKHYYIDNEFNLKDKTLQDVLSHLKEKL